MESVTKFFVFCHLYLSNQSPTTFLHLHSPCQSWGPLTGPLQQPPNLLLRIAKIILKKDKDGAVKAADFKVYYKNTVIQTVYCGHEDRKRDQRNRRRVQKQTLIFIVNWFFWQGCQGNSVGKRIIFFSPQQMVLRQLDSHMQNNKVEPLPHIICKINNMNHRTKRRTKC